MDSKTEIKIKLSPNIMKDILAFGSKEELKRLSAFITIEGNYNKLISRIVFVLGIVFNNHCWYLFSDDKKKPVPKNKLGDINTQNWLWYWISKSVGTYEPFNGDGVTFIKRLLLGCIINESIALVV